MYRSQVKLMLGSARRRDVCVVGAGPGGSAAALALAREGVPTLLLERSVFPRDKVCGDAFSGRSVGVLKDLCPGFMQRLSAIGSSQSAQGAVISSPSRVHVHIPIPESHDPRVRVPGFLVRRSLFDQELALEAAAHPEIELLQGAEVSAYEREEEGWRLQLRLDGGSHTRILRTRLVIAADGAESRLARRLAPSRTLKRSTGVGVRTYYEGVEGMQTGWIELHYVAPLFPGYLWMIPLDGGITNVGIWQPLRYRRHGNIHFRELLTTLLKSVPDLGRRFVHARRTGLPRGARLPLGARRPVLSGPDCLLVGDAASLVDPFTGEGIGNALMSGRLAGEHAARFLSTQAGERPDLRDYDRQVRGALDKEYRLTRRLSSLASHQWILDHFIGQAHRGGSCYLLLASAFRPQDRKERTRSLLYYLWRVLRRGRTAAGS
jgi:geranylgeranyl reductase family protein